jgi:SAM-dependent methyltransferase
MPFVPEDRPATEFPKWDYQEYPKTLARDDYWGQVRRTILGQRINEEDVATIVDHLRDVLRLRPADVLLDLGCGNGALSARLFDDCAGYVGADLSPYLVEVAQENFERPPEYMFFNADAGEFARTVDAPERFTRGLSFAAVQYFPLETVEAVLQELWRRFPNLSRLVLGNLPDRHKATLLFEDGYDPVVLDQHRSQIGRWWSRGEIRSLGAGLGWQVDFAQLPESVFNAKYRFDAVLTRD